MTRVAYYVPTIPDVWSTAEYQHALALVEAADESLLLSNNPLPPALAAEADRTRVLSVDGVLAKAREAAATGVEFLDGRGPYVPSPHYESALSGLLASRRGARWVMDMFETPAQYRLNQPRTYHQVTARGLAWIVSRAERNVHSFHPDTPHQFGRDRRFLTHGAPTSRIEAAYPEQDPLRMVWVGSPRLDRGGDPLVRGLAAADATYDVHVYGETDDAVVDLATELGVREALTFHGWVEHEAALAAIRDATVGYSVLPHRSDWRYAPALKMGEYLAGGTIPLAAESPGSRYILDEAGYYVDPRWDSVAAGLDDIAAMATDERTALMRAARDRGEEIPWEHVRARFAEEVGL